MIIDVKVYLGILEYYLEVRKQKSQKSQKLVYDISEDMVVVVLEYLGTKVVSRWYINYVVEKEETERVG